MRNKEDRPNCGQFYAKISIMYLYTLLRWCFLIVVGIIKCIHAAIIVRHLTDDWVNMLWADWININASKLQSLHSPAVIAYRVTHLSMQTNVTSPLCPQLSSLLRRGWQVTSELVTQWTRHMVNSSHGELVTGAQKRDSELVTRANASMRLNIHSCIVSIGRFKLWGSVHPLPLHSFLPSLPTSFPLRPLSFPSLPLG